MTHAYLKDEPKRPQYTLRMCPHCRIVTALPKDPDEEKKQPRLNLDAAHKRKVA